MNFSGVRCDECGRIKGESNHWHAMGILWIGDNVSIELGELTGPKNLTDECGRPMDTKYEVHDLCGEQCFYKHIGKLLKINPSKAPEDEASL